MMYMSAYKYISICVSIRIHIYACSRHIPESIYAFHTYNVMYMKTHISK